MKFSLNKYRVVNISLYVLLLILIALLVYGIHTAHQSLSARAREVDHLRIDSDLSEQNVLNAKALDITLAKNRDSVNRAAQIVADTKSYEYQDQIVKDISSYAAASNLTILGFDFTPSTQQIATPKRVAELNTVTANVSLKNPVPYANYLKFLKLIERNLTKMQVTQLDLTNDLKTPGAINAPSVTLEVYVR